MSPNFQPVKFRKGIQAILVVIVLLATLSIGDPFTAQAQGGRPPVLFGDADARADMTYDQPAFVMRYRYVNVNMGLLFNAKGNPQGRNVIPQIALNLFPDLNYVGVVDRLERNGGNSYSWIGRLKGVRSGYFYLVVVEGAFTAHIASTQGIYEISGVGDNLYRVVQIDQSQFVDHPADAAYDPPGRVLSPEELGPSADSGAIIDVIVFFSTAAKNGAGGVANLKSQIQTAMTETNTSYANSGVTPRLRLVHVEEVSYTESGTLSTDVNRLANTTDGYMDGVHSIRNAFGADLVMLIVESSTDGYCGWSKAIMATVTSAFAVTKRPGCMTGYYSFGHELGHLQGARHDLYMDTSDIPYTYGHGYVHKHATDAAQRWRTVMAYNDACKAVGYNCTRLQYWSNPNKTWLSAAMGVASDSENYKALNNTAATVANFKAAIISTDNFNSSFNGSSSGWSSVYGTWSAPSTYYYTYGVKNYVNSAKHTGTYGDLTYEARLYRTGCTSCANKLIIRGNPSLLNASKDWKSSYTFSYTNNGTFSVYKYDNAGTAIALKGWTTSSAIVKGGWNTLKVVAVGTSLKFYINGTSVWSGTDSSFKTGIVGVGMYQNTTTGYLAVDWAKMSTTPTSDIRFDEVKGMDEMVAPGEEIPGGDANQSP